MCDPATDDGQWINLIVKYSVQWRQIVDLYISYDNEIVPAIDAGRHWQKNIKSMYKLSRPDAVAKTAAVKAEYRKHDFKMSTSTPDGKHMCKICGPS